MAELLDEVELWHSPSQIAYATIRVRDHYENWPVESPNFRRWLQYRSWSRGESLGGAADLEKLIGGLAAMAQFAGREYKTWVRVGELDGITYVDRRQRLAVRRDPSDVCGS